MYLPLSLRNDTGQQYLVIQGEKMKKIVCLSMFAVVLGAPALGAPADCLDQANKAVFFAWDAVLESVPNARANVSPEELTSGGETQAGQNGGSDRYIYKN